LRADLPGGSFNPAALWHRCGRNSGPNWAWRELIAQLNRWVVMSFEIRPGRPDDERPVYGEHVVNGGHPGAPGGYRGPAGAGPSPTIGEFRQGNEVSQLVLQRYLLTRAIGASIVRTVYWIGIVILVLAALTWFAGVHWLAVLIGVVAIFVLLFRGMLAAIQRRISGIDRIGPASAQVERLVGQTRKGIRAELKRIGLPSAPWGPALIGLRLVRPLKRIETIRKLGSFDLGHVVPASTLDELFLLLRQAPPVA
jgi:hypothetical protein